MIGEKPMDQVMSEKKSMDERGYVPNEVPVDRCGYTTNYSKMAMSVHTNVACWRKSWNGHDLCIWHADTDDKPTDELIATRTAYRERFDGAILREVNLTDQIDFSHCGLEGADLFNAVLEQIDLTGATLSNADLTRATLDAAILTDASLNGADLTDSSLNNATLTNATLAWANLTNASLKSATLLDARLGGTNLTSVDLWEGNLTNAVLWGADLTNASLARTNLTNANFAGADLTGVSVSYHMLDQIQVDEATKFGGRCQWEVWADTNAADSIPYVPHRVNWCRVLGRPFTHPEELEQAELQYRATQRVLRENDLRQLRELAIREKHARRKRALAEHSYWTWLKFVFYRWPLGYGEQVRNILMTSLLTILGFALIYPLFGGMETTESETTVFVFSNFLAFPFEVPETAEILWANFYFSAVTFSTLGYGDIQPASAAAQGLASVQSLLGALLMAYLVFVLGRRTTW